MSGRSPPPSHILAKPSGKPPVTQQDSRPEAAPLFLTFPRSDPMQIRVRADPL